MYGIEFQGDTHNSLICGSFEFECRTINEQHRAQYKFYKLRFHPDFGMALDERNDKGEWVCILNYAKDEQVNALLPKRKDFGKDWTVQDLIFAGTFYADGHKHGYEAGRYGEIRRERNRQKGQ
jgi:hypothetical protein